MKQLFATDLDGTILPHDGQFHKNDMDALRLMGKKGIIRVVATGRSLHYAFKVMDDAFPIDYLVFSSGAGVYNWRKKEIMRTLQLNRSQVSRVQHFFTNRGLGYTLHRHIPGNHFFWYHHDSLPHPDLNRFVNSRQEFAIPIADLNEGEESFCQMLTIIDKPVEAEQIIKELEGVKTIRATSPLDGESIWIEIFHQEASKASGIAHICEFEGINSNNVWVLGNDYNDLDMLNGYYPNSFVVENAPAELKQKYQVVPAVENAGMSLLAKDLMR